MEGLGIDWKILVGQVINFAILFFLLKKFVFKAFFSILEKRKKIIEDGVRKSEDAEKNLAKIRILDQEIRAAGEKNARDLIRSAGIIADKRKQEVLDAAEKEKERIIFEAKEMAKKEAESEKEKQRKESINLSFILAEKFLKERLNQEEDKKLLEKISSNLK
ncbi:MAG: F0F1 ATP synthase subunit B [Patescibacteria group bacterium]